MISNIVTIAPGITPEYYSKLSFRFTA